MAKWLLHLLLLTSLTACQGLTVETPQESVSIPEEEKVIPKATAEEEQEEEEEQQPEEEPATARKLEITEKEEVSEPDPKPKESSKTVPSHKKSVVEEKKQTSESKNAEKKNEKHEESTVITSFEKEVVELVNKERQQRGYSSLQIDLNVTQVARKKSADMRDNGYFSHQSPTYGSPFDMLKKEQIRFTMAGENIAAGQRSPSQVVRDWMNSEGHRKNILNPDFTHIGVGYQEGGSYGTYWTQLFLRK